MTSSISDPAPTSLSGDGGEVPSVVAAYVAAEYLWRDCSAVGSSATQLGRVDAARDYIRAIDAYVAVLRATGRKIPHHLDDVAANLRATYGDAPLPTAAHPPLRRTRSAVAG